MWLLAEEPCQPSDECLAERAVNVQVARANRGAHLPRVLARRQPGVNFRTPLLLWDELSLCTRYAGDVSLRQRPHRIAVGDHLYHEVFQFTRRDGCHNCTWK